MAQDAMEGLIEVMVEQGETIPESDVSDAPGRFGRLASSLQAENDSKTLFEPLTTRVAEAA